ncbi:hypothetical protein QBC34DRAFT_441004 [Podospora aff. communis PSN243]|uniref:Uncharacterized protein n=1 Tax=Podospora aff. communis PSN243 TaxID=3040156 RepID=A0AAV9GCU1_9PEZI|nr:hypothetical protein QBC34DRAFT_441004 [Podospora aff. communis PSN243]
MIEIKPVQNSRYLPKSGAINNMEWLNRKNELSDQDSRLLQFYPELLSTSAVETIKLTKSGNDGVSLLESQSHTTEKELLSWVERTCPQVASTEPHAPTIIVVVFPRLGDMSSMTDSSMTAMCIPCGKETWRRVTSRMFQHRSLSLLLRRTSTAIIQNRFVTWQDSLSRGQSIVYGCRSDTASPTKPDDVVLSVTSFVNVPLTFAIMYGCTKNTKCNVTSFLKQIKETDQTWHPLLLPMVFVELERKRLLNLLDREKTKLQQRILEMKNRLRGESEGTIASIDTGTNEASAAVKDCEATESWIHSSKLKNGLESLRTQLMNMKAHSTQLRQSIFATNHPDHNTDNSISEHATGEMIESRLNEMIAEFDCNIRSYDSLLGGMHMAAQMEWNYYTRRDSRANIIIANATKRDGSQMRMISLLGMTFLPGTFLATMFSMGFFNWEPGDDRMISPWIGLYLGLTILLTTLTLWRWKRWTAAEEKNGLSQLKKVLESDNDSIWLDAGEKV